MSNETSIKNGRISGLTINQAFQVQLNSGDNPQISPTIDMEGMPVDIAKHLIFDALKVRGRSAMRGMKTEELKRVYKGKVSWRVLYSKAGATRQVAEVSMTDEELEAKIAELNALKTAKKDDFDRMTEGMGADEDKLSDEDDDDVETN